MTRIEKILKESIEIRDKEIATDFYRAFCNQVWYDYIDDFIISMSWRGAGRVIAEVRNAGEDYMDFYCSQDEGIVKGYIKEFLNNHGIVLFENFYDHQLSYTDFDGEVNYFKEKCPERIQYVRENNINEILK